MKSSHQLKSEKRIFLIVLTMIPIVVNAFTFYLSFTSARTNIDLVTARVVSLITKDTENNRSIASDLGAMFQLPDHMLNSRLRIDIQKLAHLVSADHAGGESPAWKADIDLIHRKKFTIMRSFWRSFNDDNKSRFTTYYIDGDAGYYYLFQSEQAIKMHGSNPHFRLSDYIEHTTAVLKNSHGFIVPDPFYSNVYEDSITHLPAMTIGSPVVIKDFSAKGSKMSGIIATDYNRDDLALLFHNAFNELGVNSSGYDMTIHSVKRNDIPMSIFPDNRAWLSFNLGDVKLMDGFSLNTRVHFLELLRIKLGGFVGSNLIMLLFLLLFIRSHRRIELMMDKLTTDSLTRALSREGGKTVIDNTPESQTTILVTLDLNDFKFINDNWGHHAGDETLIFFANYLLKSTRQGDHLIRMGGDEFILILPNTSTEQARRMMTKRAADLIGFPFENTTIPLSFSWGISDMESGFTESYKKADENLYEMKKLKKQPRAEISQTAKAI